MNLRSICLGLVSATALSLCMGVAPASATVLYNGAAKLGAGTELNSSLASSAKLETLSGTTLTTCTGGTLNGKITAAGSSSATTVEAVPSSGFALSGCTNLTAVTEGGELEWHWIPGTLNATVTAKNFKITVSLPWSGTCTYSAGGVTHLGTFKGASAAGFVAKVIIAALIKKWIGSELCPSEIRWNAEYSVTSPTLLHATGS